MNCVRMTYCSCKLCTYSKIVHMDVNSSVQQNIFVFTLSSDLQTHHTPHLQDLNLNSLNAGCLRYYQSQTIQSVPEMTRRPTLQNSYHLNPLPGDPLHSLCNSIKIMNFPSNNTKYRIWGCIYMRQTQKGETKKSNVRRKEKHKPIVCIPVIVAVFDFNLS